MSNGTMATPTLLTDPGFLYWAPIGTAIPTHTVTTSTFSDVWPVAWIPLGMTEAGTTFTSSLTVEPVTAAESFDPLVYRTTGRSATISFQLLNFTATNLGRALNGGAPTVTGTGVTTLTKVSPPSPGSEIRSMIGWESLDSTVRLICYQVINSGDLQLALQKAPATANIPWTANCEKPATTPPFDIWTAGTNRG